MAFLFHLPSRMNTAYRLITDNSSKPLMVYLAGLWMVEASPNVCSTYISSTCFYSALRVNWVKPLLKAGRVLHQECYVYLTGRRVLKAPPKVCSISVINALNQHRIWSMLEIPMKYVASHFLGIWSTGFKIRKLGGSSSMFPVKCTN